MAVIGLILILTDKQIALGISLLTAGTGLILSRSERQHDRDKENGQ